MSLPRCAEKFPARQRVYEPVVVFVPNYSGTVAGLRRHIEFVNELGFDAIGVHLTQNHRPNFLNLPISSGLRVGLRHVWEDEITTTLNAIAGPKIVFSFSFPSSAALAAIAERIANDVVGWVCDGGPFFDLFRSTWRLYSHVWPIKNPLQKAAATAAGPWWLGQLNYESDMNRNLTLLPDRFPILSVRSWQDRLVPTDTIDAVFDGHRQLHLQVLALPESDHIQGIRQDSEIYKNRVGNFLKSISKQAQPTESKLDL